MGIESADLLRVGEWMTGSLAEWGAVRVIWRARIMLDVHHGQCCAADGSCTGARIAAALRWPRLLVEGSGFLPRHHEESTG
jgi:hypothetical protein